jgi:hypothetical protein
MKFRAVVALLFVFFVVDTVSAQSVVIKPRKLVYRRAGKRIDNWKRTFEVRYPMFSGLTPGALRNLKAGTNYWSVFKTSLAENLRGEETWLETLDYVVKYNKNNLLDIWLVMEGSGAYPDGSTKYLVFDLRTGRKLTIADLFRPEALPKLLAVIRDVMRKNEAEAIKESGETREMLEQYRESESEFHPTADKLQIKDLDGFSLRGTGVTFMYDYNFAHVVQALEPSGEFYVSYTDLKPFIRPDGLLARFVR